jgi:hypothetical protein
VNKFEQCAINYICYQYMIKDFVVVERRRHFRRQGGAIFTMEMIKRHLLLVYGDAIWEKRRGASSFLCFRFPNPHSHLNKVASGVKKLA